MIGIMNRKGKKLGGSDPVCWWKPEGSETYRVVYEDLTVVDVEPDDFIDE
jgi:hypothetical protein